MLRRALRLLVALSFVASLAACSDDGSTSQEIVPPGPPTLALVAPANGTCLAIGTNVEARVPLTFEVANLTLRPPGACAGTTSCGRIAIRADGRANNEGASTVVDVLLGKLASPYHDGELHEGTGKPDLLAIEAGLVDDLGAPVLDADAEPLVVSLGLAIKASCDAPD